MSSAEKRTVVSRQIKHHRQAISWIDRHWSTRSGSFVFWPDHAWRARQREIAALAHDQAVLAQLAPPLPWAFWNCVASGWTGGRPGAGVHVSVGEGGADSYNPAGPYYGRYQQDGGFMKRHGADMLRKYGGRDARYWSVLDQTIVAERGFHVQGPGAWPNTAPPCLGLR